MAEGQIYPPQILPGLDGFARDVGGLTGIHVSKSRASDSWPWLIDVQALWQDRASPDGVLLRIYWRQRGDEWPTQYLSLDGRKSRLVDRRISLEHLGFDLLESDVKESRLGAISELMALYEEALRIREAYIDVSEDYVVARLDAAARRRTRPSTAFQKKRAAWMPLEKSNA